MGWMLNVAMGTTAVESLNTAGNIFLGQTEAPLLIRPFIKDLTRYVSTSFLPIPYVYILNI